MNLCRTALVFLASVLVLSACSSDADQGERDDSRQSSTEQRPQQPARVSGSIDRNEYRELRRALRDVPRRIVVRPENVTGPTYANETEASAAFIEAVKDGNTDLADSILVMAEPAWRLGMVSGAEIATGDVRRAGDYATSYNIFVYTNIDTTKLWQLEAAIVRGNVLDATTGTPIANASVKSHLDPDVGTRSANDGSFEVMVKPKTFRGLLTKHPDYQTRISGLPDGRSSQLLMGEKMYMDVALLRNAAPAPEVLPATVPRATAIGQIIDVDSQLPIADMEVIVMPAGAEGLEILNGKYQTVTDADGRFEIRDVPIGTHSLLARKVTPIYMHQENQFKVIASGPSHRIEAKQLKPKSVNLPIVIVGYVRDRVTGKPIKGVKVSGGVYRSIMSDDEGKFLLELATGKEWSVQATHKEYHASTTQSFSSPKPRKFETEYLLDPITTGTVFGTAINALTGEPIADATIRIAGQTVRTDSHGRFSIEEIEAGEVAVSAGQDGYRADTQTIALEALKSAEAQLVLEPITQGSVAGIVVNVTTSAPLAGVRISVAGQSTQTDTDGQFIVENIEKGDVEVAATKAVYERAVISTEVVAQEMSTLRIPLTPITYGTLSGTVTDVNTQQPMANVEISISAHGAQDIQTDAAGRFSVERVTAGDVSLTATIARYHDAQHATVLPPAKEVDVRIVMQPITTGTVRGFAKNAANGEPIANAAISIGKMRASTDIGGSFVIEQVPAGDIEVAATAKLFEADTEAVTLLAASEIRVELKLIPITYGAIAGIVTDSVTNQPLDGARVSVGDKTAITDTAGAYRFERVPAGTLQIMTVKPVYKEASTKVQLAAGATADIPIALEPITTGTVRGTVTDADTGQAIAGATISVGRLGVTSNNSGDYVISNVPAGDIELGASATLFEPGSADAVLAAAGEFQVDFALTPITYGTIVGTVVDATSKRALPGVKIRAGDKQTKSDESGSFELKRVTAGSVSVSAAKAIYVDDSRALELAAGESLNVDMQLMPITWGAISGWVVDEETGSPISGATIAVAGRTVVSDQRGQFTFGRVDAGTLSIAASKSGYHSGSLKLDLQPESSEEGTIRLAQIKVGIVRGQVIDAKTGAPIAQARVTTGGKSAETDSAGRFTFDNVNIGRALVVARHADYADGGSSGDLMGGQEIDLVIKLDLRREDVTNLEGALASEGTIDLYGIHFDSGKDQFKSSSLSTLRAVLEVMKRAPERRFQIAGHTDSDGADVSNQALSERRAKTVIGWLVRNGIPAGRLDASGFGETQPAAPNDTESGKALNRRVQLSFAE